MKTLIKNGRIVTAVDDYYADILIEGETITMIGTKLEMEADTIIDAKDMLVIPGGIDAHTHLDMPFGGSTSADDFLTGTRAAAYGGTTTIIDFAIQTKGHSLTEAIDTWHQKAAGKTAIDYGFHLIVTDLPHERTGELKRAINNE
ncbi:MAG: amidohydrolase family protein, partial [Cyanobacteria bacterium]|nr:amidohydrolase family protein [Cyanobacteriota bacterium]